MSSTKLSSPAVHMTPRIKFALHQYILRSGYVGVNRDHYRKRNKVIVLVHHSGANRMNATGYELYTRFLTHYLNKGSEFIDGLLEGVFE